MRKKVSYTVEESVIKKFDMVCKRNSVNKSALIENLMQVYIKNQFDKEVN